MEVDIHDLYRLREQIDFARAEARRFGNMTLASLLTKSIIGVDLTIAELDESHARTLPQVEALKRLVGAT